VIAYRATLDVPRELVLFTARLLAAERRRRRTPRGSRALSCFGQAVLGLRWFRDRAGCEALARDHGVSRATAYRYVDEVIAVLAARAPDLPQALERALRDGLTHVVLDGTLVRSDRCREKAPGSHGRDIDLWYSGKARSHGGNVQAVLAPGGFPLWVSPAEPGSVHDLSAARAHALPALYAAAAAGLPVLADAGYDGASAVIHIPAKQRRYHPPLGINARTRNLLLRSVRCLGERGFALLTQRWRTLQHITASPSKITAIARAALVLTHYEHGYIT
jgi:DDE superfamily endonuclease